MLLLLLTVSKPPNQRLLAEWQNASANLAHKHHHGIQLAWYHSIPANVPSISTTQHMACSVLSLQTRQAQRQLAVQLDGIMLLALVPDQARRCQLSKCCYACGVSYSPAWHISSTMLNGPA